MAVMAKETWTDHRLDDLNKRVDEGFNETREEFRAFRAETIGEFQAVRTEMKGEFQAVRAEMKGEFQAVRAEMSKGSQAIRSELGGQIAAFRRMTFQLFAGMILTSVLGFGGMIVALLTQS